MVWTSRPTISSHGSIVVSTIRYWGWTDSWSFERVGTFTRLGDYNLMFLPQNQMLVYWLYSRNFGQPFSLSLGSRYLYDFTLLIDWNLSQESAPPSSYHCLSIRPQSLWVFGKLVTQKMYNREALWPQRITLIRPFDSGQPNFFRRDICQVAISLTLIVYIRRFHQISR